MNKARIAIAALLTLLLSACGDGMKGRFEGGMGLGGVGLMDMAVIFDGHGKATMEGQGTEEQLEYEVDGDKVKLRNPKDPSTAIVLTRKDADTLVGGPMDAMEFKRKQ